MVTVCMAKSRSPECAGQSCQESAQDMATLHSTDSLPTSLAEAGMAAHLPGGRTSSPCSPGRAAGATDQRETHAGFVRRQLGLRGALQAGLERSVGKERSSDGLIPAWALGSSLVPSTGGGDREHRCPLERVPTLRTDVGPSVTQVGPPDQVRSARLPLGHPLLARLLAGAEQHVCFMSKRGRWA